MLRRSLATLALASLVAFPLAALGPANAQSEAFWSDPDVEDCCDANDCEPVAGRVLFTPEGWRIAGWDGALTLESGKVFWKPTTDRPVACSFTTTRQRQRLKCLFFREEEG